MNSCASGEPKVGDMMIVDESVIVMDFPLWIHINDDGVGVVYAY